MHPIVHHTCKIKKYSRRNDIQQTEYHKQEGNKHTYRHTQTLIGEEQKSKGEQKETEQLGPKEDARNMRDCTTRKNHDGIMYKHKRTTGIIMMA
eukprot:3846146-Heterocapsa_arctica.AAC.1